MDQSLFPKREEWGTGDEALDLKLSASLVFTCNCLSLDTIAQFYSMSSQITPRVHNPNYKTTIEYLIKALLYWHSPETPINLMMAKLRGSYDKKIKRNFDWHDLPMVLNELQAKKYLRYDSQLDFSLIPSSTSERNPFVREPITRSGNELHVKILFKDFKNYLSGSGSESLHDNVFFQLLRQRDTILVIEEFAEIWFHEGSIFTLPLFSKLDSI